MFNSKEKKMKNNNIIIVNENQNDITQDSAIDLNELESIDNESLVKNKNKERNNSKTKNITSLDYDSYISKINNSICPKEFISESYKKSNIKTIIRNINNDFKYIEFQSDLSLLINKYNKINVYEYLINDINNENDNSKIKHDILEFKKKYPKLTFAEFISFLGLYSFNKKKRNKILK